MGGGKWAPVTTTISGKMGRELVLLCSDVVGVVVFSFLLLLSAVALSTRSFFYGMH